MALRCCFNRHSYAIFSPVSSFELRLNDPSPPLSSGIRPNHTFSVLSCDSTVLSPTLSPFFYSTQAIMSSIITEPLRTLSFTSASKQQAASSPAPSIPAAIPVESDYKYARFLPSFDPSLRLPRLEPFVHVDPGTPPSHGASSVASLTLSIAGLKALDDPEPRSFLNGASVEELTPEFGSEIEGLQLHSLDTRGRQQLARFVAERGVVVRGSPCEEIDAKELTRTSIGFQGSGLHRPGSRVAATRLGSVSLSLSLKIC